LIHRQLSFEERFGVRVRNFGFTQIPNIAVRYMKKIGTKPIDFTILTYLLSFPPEDYHAISSISDAIGVHPRTIRSSFLRMEKKRLIRRIFRTGEANVYDITGWVDKIQAYAISRQTPTQKSVRVPIQNLHRDSTQYLDTNKEQRKEKDSTTGKQRFEEMRRRRGV